MKLANEEEINALTQQALRINQILSQFLLGKNIILVDFKLEFGRTDEGDIVLADEISPDTCRFLGQRHHGKSWTKIGSDVTWAE